MAGSNGKRPEMTVRVYAVQPLNEEHTLEDVCEKLSRLDIEGRNRDLLTGTVRVEKIERPTPRRPYWLMDFVRLRYNHGPGRASERRPVKGFDMANGDGFAEETAMLYCPKHGMIFSQYNHFGVKDGSAWVYQ